MSDNNEDGRKLRNARLDKGYTQQEVADRAGLHHSYIFRVEDGSRRLSYKSKVKLNKVLGGNIFECEKVSIFTERRIAKGYTQRELGEVLGVSEHFVCSLERGRKEIPNKIIPKLNEILGMDFKCRPELSGDALRRARIAKGHTQEEVAIAMKASQNIVSEWELGYHKISLSKAQQLIALLNIPQE